MAFPTTPILDNFNRVNQGPPPSASWHTPLDDFLDPLDGCIVSSNEATHQAAPAGLFGYATWNAATFGPDSEVYADAGTTGIFPFRLHARMTGINIGGFNNSYFLHVSSSAIQIFKSVGGTNTLLGTLVRTNAAGESFGLEMIGSTLKGYFKPVAGAWTVALTVTDTTYTAAGRLGIALSAISPPNVRTDNFGGGTVVVGGGNGGGGGGGPPSTSGGGGDEPRWRPSPATNIFPMNYPER